MVLIAEETLNAVLAFRKSHHGGHPSHTKGAKLVPRNMGDRPFSLQRELDDSRDYAIRIFLALWLQEIMPAQEAGLLHDPFGLHELAQRLLVHMGCVQIQKVNFAVGKSLNLGVARALSNCHDAAGDLVSESTADNMLV